MPPVDDQEPGKVPAQDDADFSAGFESANATGQAPPEDQQGQNLQGGEGKDPSDAGAQEPPASAKAAEAPQDAPPAKSPGSFDPWVGMSPEQRAHWERVQHSEQSQRGRIAALTRKANAAPPPPAAEPQQHLPNEDKSKTTKEQSVSQAEEKFNRLKAQAEEYPDVVGAAAEVLADLKSQLDEIGSAIKPMQENQDAAQHARAYADLESKHSDFRDFIGNQEFIAWVEKQPAGIQQLANSYDASEISSVLSLYKMEQSATVQPSETQQQGNGQKSATEAKRERQLDGSKAVNTRGAPAAAGIPDDFGAAFSARSQQLAKAPR